MAKQPTEPPKKKNGRTPSGPTPPPSSSGEPHFGQPTPTADPHSFKVAHASDTAAYKILDKEAGTLKPLPFPASRGGTEPVLKLADVFGKEGTATINGITQNKQIVFHAAGDTGNTRSVLPQNAVTDKMVADFQEQDPAQVPAFLLHLGDVVYSFGEAQYYYDQFYEPYRNYPRPVIAIPGNHDGMVAPGSTTPTLQAYLRNFCATAPDQTAESGGLDRTAMIQPGVYYTLEAPFVRILALYSNRLEDPGVISSQGGTYKDLTDVQLAFLKAALARVAAEKFAGAVIIAVHHPPYTTGKHGSSTIMLQEMDAISKTTGVWPHAVLSGHAHSYQRYTRTTGAMEIPYVISGNGGHGLTPLVNAGSPALRVPAAVPNLAGVTFENYDDKDYGYLRVIVNAQQLRIEYHPAADGAAAKTPDDSVTVDLNTRKLVQFKVASA
ncbi:MAG TPA: metallophosphoesterase [Bryobacteraceae bacterium]|nr:metallophosphoesterase [Bryobacteraceae bacterium]